MPQADFAAVPMSSQLQPRERLDRDGIAGDADDVAEDDGARVRRQEIADTRVETR